MRRTLVVTPLAVGLILAAAAPSREASGIRNGLIAYVSDRSGSYDIWLMRADGTHPRDLTPTKVGSEHCPSWSPDGRWLAYTRSAVYLDDIWLVRADGSGRHRLTSLRGAETCPNWSPDGSRLVFVRRDSSDPRAVIHDVYTIGVNGRGLRRLTTQQEAWGVADWSRGGRIVYENTRTPLEASSLWSMRADGSDRRQVTHVTTPEHDFEPNWSPDGRRIVFSSNREGGTRAIWLVAADGSPPERLTHVGVDEWTPRFSPDGQKILVSRTDQVAGKADLYVLDLDGSVARRLTRSDRVELEPDWQPLR